MGIKKDINITQRFQISISNIVLSFNNVYFLLLKVSYYCWCLPWICAYLKKLKNSCALQYYIYKVKKYADFQFLKVIFPQKSSFLQNFGLTRVRALPLAAGRNEGDHYFRYIIDPSRVRVLPLAAGRNEGGHYFRYIILSCCSCCYHCYSKPQKWLL